MYMLAEGIPRTRALFQGSSKSIINLDRTHLRLVIGQLVYIKASNELFSRSKSAEETPLHVLNDCVSLLQLRNDILRVDKGVNINIIEMRVGKLLRFAKGVGLNSCL